MKRRWNKRKVIVCGLLVVALSSFTACTSSENTTAEKIDGLDQMGSISVITREEGSGTRGVFAEKVNLENKEDSSNADKITTNAKIAMNAETVLEEVAADKNAVGYVSLGAIKDDMKGIKVIAVNKVTPEAATISSDKYSLSRNFNIAYSGNITPVGNDFLTYILSAGQDVAGQNYTSVKSTSTFLSDQSEGTLTISGSSSAAPLLEELVKDYTNNYNPKANITVQTSDSTAGLTAAMQGSSDWGMASRELKSYEQELLTYETIAKDGVAIVVNAENPVESLTVEQLTQIYDGTDTKWSDLNK